MRAHASRPPAAEWAARPGGRPPLPAVSPARHPATDGRPTTRRVQRRPVAQSVHPLPPVCPAAARRFDLFHVADHTYAQLVHALPADRVGVYCHDLDAFRSLSTRSRTRPRWFRALARRILSGMQKAAVVFHNTVAVGEQIKRAGLVAPRPAGPRAAGCRIRVRRRLAATLGPVLPWLAEVGGQPWVLHVGTCIPRKRIDVLLDVCAAVRKTFPDLRLVKVSGEWTADHRQQIARLGLAGAITHVYGLTRAELAEVYRRATVVLMPSEAEGFGLPVIEALACGAAVVASDIPALREAGGPAAVYAPVGDVGAWSDAVAKLLADPASAPPRCGAASVGGAFLLDGPRGDHRPGIPPAPRIEFRSCQLSVVGCSLN